MRCKSLKDSSKLAAGDGNRSLLLPCARPFGGSPRMYRAHGATRETVRRCVAAIQAPQSALDRGDDCFATQGWMARMLILYAGTAFTRLRSLAPIGRAGTRPCAHNRDLSWDSWQAPKHT